MNLLDIYKAISYRNREFQPPRHVLDNETAGDSGCFLKCEGNVETADVFDGHEQFTVQESDYFLACYVGGCLV